MRQSTDAGQRGVDVTGRSPPHKRAASLVSVRSTSHLRCLISKKVPNLTFQITVAVLFYIQSLIEGYKTTQKAFRHQHHPPTGQRSQTRMTQKYNCVQSGISGLLGSCIFITCTLIEHTQELFVELSHLFYTDTYIPSPMAG